MHIYEGILAGTTSGQVVLAAGAVAAAGGTALGLARLDYQRVPQVAVLSAAFFAASLIQVPLGPIWVHPMLGGLIGLVLGWAAFPALLVALLLQALFFSMGGLTALGVNTLIMATPAVICHYLFRGGARSHNEALVFAAGFAAAATAILLGALLCAAALVAADQAFRPLGGAVLVSHLLIAVIEGLITGSVVVLLRKVRPELLDAPLLAPGRREALDG